MASYCETPLLVICEVQVPSMHMFASRSLRASCDNAKELDRATCLPVQPKDQGLPTTAYYAKTEVREVSNSVLQCIMEHYGAFLA